MLVLSDICVWFLGLNALNLLNGCLSGEQAILLESENLLMKMKIEKLEFELETEKIRSRHFEGISQIAMMELQKENRFSVKSNRLFQLIHNFEIEMRLLEDAKVELVNRFNKLRDIASSMNSILQ